jgi:hypothetical protein
MTDLPAEITDAAERLTRRARSARTPDVEAGHRERRDALLDEHGYIARVREEDSTVVLVLYPADWLDDEGTVRTDWIEDLDRAVEIQLEGGEDPDDWDAVDTHNRAVVERVHDDHGEDYGANVAAFADFMGNHYAKPIERATEREREEFRTEYYRRNVWPSDDQRALLEESLALAVETAQELSQSDSCLCYPPAPVSIRLGVSFCPE